MKSKYIVFVLPLILFGCYDDFQFTNSRFETDKEIYEIGESFDLNFILSSPKERTVRFSEDYSNIDIWTSLREPCNSNSTDWCNKKASFGSRKLSKVSVLTYEVLPEKPFKKTFLCETKVVGDSVQFEISELNYVAKFSVDDFQEGTRFAIHGLCIPIHPNPFDALEDYVEYFDLKLVLPDSLSHTRTPLSDLSLLKGDLSPKNKNQV